MFDEACGKHCAVKLEPSQLPSSSPARFLSTVAGLSFFLLAFMIASRAKRRHASASTARDKSFIAGSVVSYSSISIAQGPPFVAALCGRSPE
jgi:hypothetical protein